MPDRSNKPLACPGYGSGMSWNGTPFVWAQFRRTEHEESAPSSRLLEVPELSRRRESTDRRRLS
jgi:hypothetical protein